MPSAISPGGRKRAERRTEDGHTDDLNGQRLFRRELE